MFLPSGCSVPHHSGPQLHAIMASFAFVLVVGDSVSRQMSQGLRLVESDEYRIGGLLWSERQLPNSSCVCDGQFSESLRCRNAAATKGYKSRFRFVGAENIFDNTPELRLLQARGARPNRPS